MLLRASGEREGRTYDPAAVTHADRDSGVDHGRHLIALTDAALELDPAAVATARAAAVPELGEQEAVDALVVAAAFNGITRVADSTGIPLDESTLQGTVDLRADAGIDAFDYASKAARYA